MEIRIKDADTRNIWIQGSWAALFILIMLLATAISCGEQNDADGGAFPESSGIERSSSEGSTASQSESPQDSASLLAYLLEDTSEVVVYDAREIVSGQTPDGVHEEFEEAFGYLENLGVWLDDLEELATDGAARPEWTLMMGDLDFDGIRDELDALGFEEDTYRNDGLSGRHPRLPGYGPCPFGRRRFRLCEENDGDSVQRRAEGGVRDGERQGIF